MSQRPKHKQTIPLFPFLAVLVCTMGSLIFLLLVTTTMIRDSATGEVVSVKAASQFLLLSVTKSPPLTEPPLPPTVPLESEQPAEPTEPKIDVRAVALAQRQQEQDALTAQWQGRLNELSATRDERARYLAQRQQLQQGAAKRVGTMKLQLHDMEVKLGQMTGELAVPSGNGDGTEKERKELEAQVKELRQRLRATQDASNEDRFEVVPFDVITGTSRRPILIECTSSGLRFIPEDITIKPDDLTGFTTQVNPLIVGTSALVNYWTAWNIRQPNPAREPEPYVLLLVRPSGTISYYVAMRMLSDLKQAHGYELIEEDTALQMPPLDAGSKAACESAVKRLLSERDQILRQAGNGGGGGGYGTGRGRPAGGYGTGPGGGSGSGRGGPGGGSGGAFAGGGGAGGRGDGGMSGGRGGSGSGGSSNGAGDGDLGSEESGGGRDEFLLSDIMSNEKSSDGDYNRVENFEGTRRSTRGGGGPGGGSIAGGKGGTGQGTMTGDGSGARAVGSGAGTVGGSGTGSGTSGRMVTARGADNPVRGAGLAGPPGSVPSSGGATEDSGIEDLTGGQGQGGSGGPGDPESQGTDPRGSRMSGQGVDIGLGSSGKRAIPVEDHRSGRKRKAADGQVPTDPEHLAGRHWGISEPGAAIGLERDVRVDVEKNRYVIGKKHGVPLVDTDSREDTFVKMITVMDLQARDWGKPPQGFFWKPSLRFVIADGADANYDRVQPLFERAGISSTREFPHDHPPEAAAKPAAPPTTYTPTPAPKPTRRLFPGIMR